MILLKRSFAYVLVVVIFASISGWAESVSPTEGGIHEGLYTNSFFNFSFPIPKEWHVASAETMEVLKDVGSKAFSGEDKILKAAVETAKKTTQILLTISEKLVGVPVEFNPSIVILAEKISYAPGIQTGQDYLFHARRMLVNGNLPYHIEEEPYSCNVGGKTFYCMETSIRVIKKKIYQTYKVEVVKGHALFFILTGSSKGEMKKLDQWVQKVRFQ